jgi:very-short-patch-repair endonuclease
MTEETRQNKGVQLFAFVREFARLNTKPVESLDSYIKTFWLDEIPEEPECNFVGFAGPDDDGGETVIENWLAVERPERPDPPAVSEDLIPWLNKRQWQDSSIEVPELDPRILNPDWDDENPEAQPQFLDLEDYPHIQDAWEDYVEAEWWPWAEVDRRKAHVQVCYDELFAMHRTQVSVAEQYEFLLSVGCLHWSTPSGAKVKRHLLTLPVTIEFDSVNAVVAVRSAGTAPEARLEADMLTHDRPPIDIEEDAEARCSLLGDNLFHADAKTLLRAYVQGLDSEGVFVDAFEQVTGAPPAKPVVAFAPALIVRRRTSRSLIAVCDSIIDQLQGDEGTTVPAGVRKLVGELGVDEAVFGEVDADGDGGQVGEVYFPLPSNEEQRQILGRLSRQVGVLVQGPPGTGKSQTIANLTCHLLATGKRILVTSQKAPALRVLKEKLPPEVADLCVMVLGEGPDEQHELRRSVGKVASRHAGWSRRRSEQHIRDLAGELQRTRGSEATAYERLCAVREKETFRHPVLFGGYEGTLGDIAGHVRQREDAFAWFEDRLPDDTDLVVGTPPDCPVEGQPAQRILALLRGIDPDEEERSQLALLPLEDIPSIDDFRKLIGDEKGAESRFNELAQFLEHPARVALGSLPTEELSSLRTQLADFYGRLRATRNSECGWEWSVADGVLRGNTATWEALRDASSELLELPEDEAKVVGDLEVAGLGDRSFRAILKDAEELKAHLDQGGRRGFWLFRPTPVKQGLYLIREATVDGRSCASPVSLDSLIRWLRLHESTKKLGEQWSVLTTVETNGLPLNQAIGAYRELQSRLETVLRLGAEAGALGERLGACDRGIAQHWYDLEAVEALLRLVEALLAERELHEVRQRIAEVETCVHTFCLKPQTAPENHRVRNAVHGRLSDEYVRSVRELDGLWKCRRLCQERDQILKQVRRVLPKLASALTSSYDDEAWDSRLRGLDDAWNWVCADEWLSQMTDPQLEDSLNQQVRQAKRQGSRTLSRLASEKAWQHCMESMTEQSFQSLMAWRKAIERLGKGTGKYAERNRRLAKERLEECRDAIPAWVMPVYKVLDTVTVAPGVFDVAIIDEASQSGPEALFLAFLAKQIVVVGDDQQIRPENVGIDHNDVHQLQQRYLRDVPKWDIFGATESLFSIAEVRFGNPIRLREHFRCMPEIIAFSNRLCYQDQPLIPLRQFGNDRLAPVLRPHYVSGGYQETRKVNPVEADAVVEAIERCCDDPAYDGKTMGVISLLHSSDQDRGIESRLIKRLDAEEIEQRNIVCGDAYDFQGDERDVIFLSMVSARSDNGRIGTMSDERAKRRFNVAVSRGKDQVFLFHSVQEAELGQACLRRRLLAHMKQPSPDPTAQLPWTLAELHSIARNSPRNQGNQPAPFDSWFEVDVYLAIADQGYLVIPQHEEHGYRIDICIVGGTRKLAVECDGDHWHGPERHADDLHRQNQLERCHWEFFRVRGSRFYRDPATALSPLWKMLEPEEPEPEDSDEEVPEITPDDVSDGPEIVDDSENDAPFDSGESDDDVEAEPPEAGTAPKQAKLEGRSGHGPRNAPKGNSPRTFTLDDVLSLPNRRLGAAIVDVLEECSNYSSKKDDLVKRVTKHFGFRTSGEPRKKLSRKIGWAVTHLKKAGLVEEYKAKNVRVRLRNPSRQGRLSFPDGATVRDNSKTESQQEAALDEE